MSDLISRQAAIDALRNINAIARPISISEDVLLIDKAEAMTELQMLPSAQPEVLACGEGELSAQPEQRWIPVTERMPEYDDEYLVTKKCFGWNCKEYYEPDIARYEKRDGWHKSDEVLAWMPLPEPYKEDGEADD